MPKKIINTEDAPQVVPIYKQLTFLKEDLEHTANDLECTNSLLESYKDLAKCLNTELVDVLEILINGWQWGYGEEFAKLKVRLEQAKKLNLG